MTPPWDLAAQYVHLKANSARGLCLHHHHPIPIFAKAHTCCNPHIHNPESLPCQHPQISLTNTQRAKGGSGTSLSSSSDPAPTTCSPPNPVPPACHC
ncbi:hypothetical protein F751_4103 [Auxenochlorella protothecoides]|uniref:Uncharacterized protein n=1 Tax=Auxenochlorella protothecoides TaxID=3075 RepID=A0A087ST85_AUXPR|nr:hypothetical protein F751_4103 [Auxenochlorella protothecoides]KFM28939.1 hypothetical protein F751_4103 [Auxenochlorella protothecoides]